MKLFMSMIISNIDYVSQSQTTDAKYIFAMIAQFATKLQQKLHNEWKFYNTPEFVL